MLTNDSFETLSVSPAYPGHLLTTGSNSSEVARIQTYLNALRVDNPVSYTHLPKSAGHLARIRAIKLEK